ncbi:hypothetical protein GF385_03125 [Candidatus Dependentiae bacterium]|nr:hypothetical protein [Candidatus Dependentiae bacterium]
MIYIFRKEMKKWHSILWAVFASLALGGVLGYINYKRTQPSEITIATVNGEDVKLLDFQKALQDIRSQIEMYREYARATGISVDLFLSMAGLQNPEKAAFQNCLNNRLLDTQKDYFNIELSQEYFLQELASKLPDYLKDQMGNINLQAYKSYLARMNTTPAKFEERMEKNFERELFEEFVATSNYVTYSKAKEIFTNNIAKKSFYLLYFPIEKYLKNVKEQKIDKKTLLNFFNKNKEDYRIPEKRKASYWILNSEDYNEKVTVEESSIVTFYEKNKNSLFRIPPKVKVRHILFEINKDYDSEKIEKILEKAKELRKDLIKNPSKFGEFAKEYSADEKTAKNGGLIGFIEKGKYDSEFEKAAYRLYKKGEISELIKTEGGFELIQLVERVPASSKSLESVRAEILKTIKAKKAFSSLRADVQRIIYESRTDDKAPIEFFKNNNVAKKETKLLTLEDSRGEDLKNMLAEKLFANKKKKNEFGSFLYKDDIVIYQVTNINKTHIPKFKKVKNNVLDDFCKSKAKIALKADLKKAKRDLLNKNKTIKKIGDELNLKLEITKNIKNNEELEGLGLDSSFSKKAFLLNSTDQALTYRNDYDYYLVQLKNIEQTNLISFNDEKQKIINSEKSKNKSLYLKGFIASLLRNARIEKHEKFLNFEKNKLN